MLWKAGIVCNEFHGCFSFMHMYAIMVTVLCVSAWPATVA